MRDYSLKIAEEIEQFLRDDDWRFDPADENGMIRLSVSLKCKFSKCRVNIQVRKNSYLIVSSLPITADEASRPAVMEFLTRANYGLILGHFEMDLSDGEVRYKCAQYCGNENVLISGEIIKETLYVGLSMLERYGTPLLEVMMGITAPLDALKKAEGDS